MAHEATGTIPNCPQSVAKTFRDRCRTLGLFCWRCDATGAIVQPPEEPGFMGMWLSSPILRTQVEKAVGAWLVTDQPHPTEPFPGCWLLPVIDRQALSTNGLTAAIALDESCLQTEWFEVICAGSALETEPARNTVAPFARYKPKDIDNLINILKWNHNDLAQSEMNQRAIDRFSEELIQAYEQSHFLSKLGRFMNCGTQPAEMMQAVCQQIADIMPFAWIGIQFDNSDAVATELAGKLFLVGDLPCNHDLFRQKTIDLIKQIAIDDWTRLHEPQKSELAAMVRSELLIDPITHDNQAIGVLIAGNKVSPDPEISSIETHFLDATADFLGVFHENVCRFEHQNDMFFGTLKALTVAVDAKDHYTHGHSERVGLLSYQLARAMGIDKQKCERIRITGLLHDVGKIGVPEAVLCKQGKLTQEEFDQIKLHTIIGHNILKDIPSMQDILPGVLYHHERWDGRGYPEGLSGENIPILGRTLALADTFDAMSSDRSYRSALPREKVLEEIGRCAGSQFDPELAKLFLTIDLTSYDLMVAYHHSTADFAI